ncbi:trypsin-like serine peptidase [Streptomyces sp. NPDC086787]|uniref:trypsin-like serine peptidase n=1 Tax=Streptomyces sp. NPDC086787 TaxID=3365759 RepID=UPI0037F405CD
MRSSSRRVPALALGLCAVILGNGQAFAAQPDRPAGSPASSASAASPASPPSALSAGASRLNAEEKYWTAGRMGAAIPFDGAAPRRSSVAGPGARSRPPAGTPKPEYFGGHPMVGTFFFDGRPLGGKSTYCTGSVVHTAAHDIVLTAGHCALGMATATHRVFVPQYRDGLPAARQPRGVFPVTRLYIDPRYQANTKQPTSNLDLAFARVSPSSRGMVETVTGALTFTPSASYNHRVTVIGYPGAERVNPKHQAIRCPVTTSRLSGLRQLRMTCTGYYGGVSGGPWIEDYNRTTGTGKVVGNTGGYNGGGDDADDDWVTYAPVYGNAAQLLFQDASAHRTVAARPAYQQGVDSPVVPGPALP